MRELLFDNRISADARIIGAYLSMLATDEEGFVELPYDEVRKFLFGFPSDDVIRKHIRMLEGSDWVERKRGGKGHSDRFRLRENATLKDRPADTRPYNGFRLASEPSLTGGSSSVVVDGEEEAPPISPPELATVAQHTIEDYGEVLAGCRDSLREYVAKTVDAGNQSQYIHTVAAWVNGGDEEVWRLPDGGLLEPEKRSGLMAVAVNELGAGDEEDMYHRPGHTGNLRTKIGAILKQRAKHGARSKWKGDSRRDTGPSPRKAKPGGGIAGDRGGGFRYEGGGDDGDSALSGMPAA